MGNRGNAKYLLIILSICLVSVVCNADRPATKVAEKLAKEKGLTQPTEFLRWSKEPKDISNDWDRLENKYFSISYPKCFSIEANGGETDDTKLSPGISLIRGSFCPLYKKNWGDFNRMSIMYTPYSGISDLKWGVAQPKEVFRQKGYINGVEFNLVGDLMDDYNYEKKIHDPEFRWELTIICNKKPFSMGSYVPPGKPTMDLLNNKLEFPKDFEEIISTFRCK